MITQKVIDQIRHNKTCKSKLQLALNKGGCAIQRYLDTNNIVLTTVAALTVIREELGLTNEEILEPVKTLD